MPFIPLSFHLLNDLLNKRIEAVGDISNVFERYCWAILSIVCVLRAFIIPVRREEASGTM